MTPRVIVGRAAAVCSAVLLFGVYVYHQGCAAPNDDNGNGGNPATNPVAAPGGVTQPTNVRLLPGSKAPSSTFDVPSSPAPGGPHVPDFTTKRAAVFTPAADRPVAAGVTATTTQPAGVEKPPVLMPGSKSRSQLFTMPIQRSTLAERSLGDGVTASAAPAQQAGPTTAPANRESPR